MGVLTSEECRHLAQRLIDDEEFELTIPQYLDMTRQLFIMQDIRWRVPLQALYDTIHDMSHRNEDFDKLNKIGEGSYKSGAFYKPPDGEGFKTHEKEEEKQKDNK